jgi:hypothetical protein
VTNNINTGPQGDCDPTRAIFNIALMGDGDDNDEPASDDNVGQYKYLNTNQQRFGGLDNMRISATRTFQFSEIQPTQFFITQVSAGQQPTLFDANNPPAVVTTQGSAEKWIVQNIAQENHEFHMHPDPLQGSLPGQLRDQWDATDTGHQAPVFGHDRDSVLGQREESESEFGPASGVAHGLPRDGHRRLPSTTATSFRMRI